MCCFAQSILRVFDTFIFGRLDGDGSQYLVYEMKYESETKNAMILPIPVRTPAAQNSVTFIDLQDYEHFFADLSSAFPFVREFSIGCGMPESFDAVAAGAIEVHEIGNYEASFVPKVKDFVGLDPRFVIPKETWDKIPEYSDYGFVVFQLKELSGRPHPMAFKFKTRSDKVFFPTVHIHDGEVHDRENFDHALYLQHAGYDTVVGRYNGPNSVDRSTGLVRSKDVAREYCQLEKAKSVLAPDLLIHKTTLRGNLPNKDTFYFSKRNPIHPGLNFRKWLSYWPLTLPVAAMSWLIYRRSILAKDADDTQPHPN